MLKAFFIMLAADIVAACMMADISNVIGIVLFTLLASSGVATVGYLIESDIMATLKGSRN